MDDKGQSRWVQSEAQVPEQYRGKAEKPALPTIMQGNGAATRGLDSVLQRLPEQKRPVGREAPREMTQHERDVLEWERNQAAIADAKQAEFDKKLARKCDNVRSDQATPALLLQCQRLLGR